MSNYSFNVSTLTSLLLLYFYKCFYFVKVTVYDSVISLPLPNVVYMYVYIADIIFLILLIDR